MAHLKKTRFLTAMLAAVALVALPAYGRSTPREKPERNAPSRRVSAQEAKPAAVTASPEARRETPRRTSRKAATGRPTVEKPSRLSSRSSISVRTSSKTHGRSRVTRSRRTEPTAAPTRAARSAPLRSPSPRPSVTVRSARTRPPERPATTWRARLTAARSNASRAPAKTVRALTVTTPTVTARRIAPPPAKPDRTSRPVRRTGVGTQRTGTRAAVDVSPVRSSDRRTRIRGTTTRTTRVSPAVARSTASTSIAAVRPREAWADRMQSVRTRRAAQVEIQNNYSYDRGRHHRSGHRRRHSYHWSDWYWPTRYYRSSYYYPRWDYYFGWYYPRPFCSTTWSWPTWDCWDPWWGISYHDRHWSIRLSFPRRRYCYTGTVYVERPVVTRYYVYKPEPILDTYDGVDRLIDALKYGDVDQRRGAARELGSLETLRALYPLIYALEKDEDLFVRFYAAKSLGKLSSRDALPALRKAAAEDPEEIVRDEAAEAIEAILE